VKEKHVKVLALVLIVMLALAVAAWVGAGTTGIISGVVKSADDGKPLSGVNIFVTGTKLTTVTDANGYFVITNVPPGDYEVRAEIVGYAKNAQDKVTVSMDSTATTSFEMKQEAIVEKVTTVTRTRSMIAPDVINTLDLVSAGQENLTRTDPTAVHTVPGVLSTLPGVNVEPNGTGAIHIRGGRSDQVGYYIEGIPITDPNTGMFSDNLFSTGVGKFQAYTGGFGAEYGNAIAGVLNEVKKTGDTNQGLNLEMDGGNEAYRSTFGEMGGKSPNGMSYYVGTVLQKNEINGAPILDKQSYSDNVAKVVWPWKNDTLTLLGLQGYLQGEAGFGSFLRQRYYISGATWSHNYGPKSFLTVQPYYIFCQAIQDLANSPDYGFMVNSWSAQKGLQASYTSQISEKHLMKIGGLALLSTNREYLDWSGPWYRADVDTFQTALYVQDEYKPMKKLTANAGVRYEGITYDRTGRQWAEGAGYTGAPIGDAHESVVSPRLGLAYAPDDRSAWKVDWGKYAKWIPACFVQVRYTNPDDPSAEAAMSGLGTTSPQESTASELSYERQLNDSTAMRVTPFVADYRNLGDYATDHGITRYTSLGKGKASGTEVYLRKKMSNNWQGWFSYTYQKVKANVAGASEMYYTSWNQLNTFALVAEYRSGKWAHTLRADLGNGRTDISSYDPTVRLKSNPYAIVTYGLTLSLPKGSAFGDTINVNVFNVFNNRQAMQYTYDSASAPGQRAVDSFVPERFVSIGFDRAF